LSTSFFNYFGPKGLKYVIPYTNEGMTVLDNCMGSGTTGVACVNTKRDFIGIEMDATYFAIASLRIAQAECQQRSEDFKKNSKQTSDLPGSRVDEV
jgi:DNA modification methylase